MVMTISSVIILIIITFFLFLLLLWLLTTKPSNDDKPLPPVRGDELAVFPFEPMPLMTDTEVLFFNKLQQALPEYLIFSQVQLSRVIAPLDDDEIDQSFWFNRICRMSVDYVVVATDCQTVLLAIELDDWTHHNRRRQQQDDKKDKALSSAGIAIVRFHGEAMPDVNQLRHTLLAVMAEAH